MSSSGTDGCQSVVTFWHHYNFKYSSRQAVFLGFEILKWSDRFKEKMCKKKKGRERARERKRERHSCFFFLFLFFFFSPFFFSSMGQTISGCCLVMKTQSQRSLSDEVFLELAGFFFSLFLYLMITLDGFAPHGMVRAAQFCSPLISAFEAQSSEAAAKKTPHQAGSKIRQSSLP